MELQIQNLVTFKKDTYHKKELPINPEYITDVLTTVCKVLNVRIVDVLGNRRFSELVNARVIITRICSDKVNDKEKLKYRGKQGWTVIANMLNKKHCTAIYWDKVFDVDFKNKDFQDKYYNCVAELNKTLTN